RSHGPAGGAARSRSTSAVVRRRPASRAAAAARSSATGETSTSVTSSPRRASQSAWRPGPPATSSARPLRGRSSSSAVMSGEGAPITPPSRQRASQRRRSPSATELVPAGADDERPAVEGGAGAAVRIGDPQGPDPVDLLVPGEGQRQVELVVVRDRALEGDHLGAGRVLEGD